MATGADDGRISLWKDVTTEEARKEQKIKEKRVSEITKVDEFMKIGDLLNVCLICLDKRRIIQLRAIFENYDVPLEDLMLAMNKDQLAILIQFLQKWNTNARTCHLRTLLFSHLALNLDDGTLNAVEVFKEFCGAYESYGERHYSRISTLKSKAYLLDVILTSSG